MRNLTSLQAHSLAVLIDCGACDAAEVARHLNIDARSLGSVLRGLEHRGLIERTYTGHRFSGHAYYATGRGEDAHRAEFGDEGEAA